MFRCIWEEIKSIDSAGKKIRQKPVISYVVKGTTDFEKRLPQSNQLLGINPKDFASSVASLCCKGYTRFLVSRFNALSTRSQRGEKGKTT